jgi:hypothetical protein
MSRYYNSKENNLFNNKNNINNLIKIFNFKINIVGNYKIVPE